MVTATKPSWITWLHKPVLLRRVSGHSMEPTLYDGDLVVALKRKDYKNDDVVIARLHGREVVKRLRFAQGKAALMGDNINPHHDITSFSTENILGKVVWPKI